MTLIRLARVDDLPQVAHIARLTWDTTYNKTIAPENRREFLERAYKLENLERALNTLGHWLYVAEVEQQVIGFGHFVQRYHPIRARAELIRLYVLPDYQNLTIGHTLLTVGFAALAKAGIVQCFVSVQSSNSLARKFYERHGFTFHQTHGQFLGTQIVTMVEYVHPITEADMEP